MSRLGLTLGRFAVVALGLAACVDLERPGSALPPLGCRYELDGGEPIEAPPDSCVRVVSFTDAGFALDPDAPCETRTHDAVLRPGERAWPLADGWDLTPTEKGFVESVDCER